MSQVEQQQQNRWNGRTFSAHKTRDRKRVEERYVSREECERDFV